MVFKKLINLHEEITHRRLEEVCDDCEARVFTKIRVADVLPIEKSGISDALYKYALQAHFDFVVCDLNHMPLFAVEFDGPSHASPTQKVRDNKKNSLCETFKFPLLRINSEYLQRRYRGLDILTWFIEVYFLRDSFYEAQSKGHIPYDEPFDPAFLDFPDRDQRYHLRLSLEASDNVMKLFEDGKVYDPGISFYIGRDKNDNYHAIGFILINAEEGVMAFTGMHKQLFPLPESDILDEIIVCEVYSELVDVLNSKKVPVDINTIEKEINYHKNNYELSLAHSCRSGFRKPLLNFTAQ